MSKKKEQEEGDGTKLKDKIKHVLTECRVVLPGAQALLGFQFITTLTEAFEKLPQSSKYMHLSSLALVALSIVLLMTPAAYHRIVERDRISDYFVRLASVLIAGAMVPLALGISLDIFVIARMVFESPALSIAVAAATILLFCSLWFVFPLLRRVTHRQGNL